MIQTSVFLTDTPPLPVILRNMRLTGLMMAHQPPKQKEEQESLVMFFGHVLRAEQESPVN